MGAFSELEPNLARAGQYLSELAGRARLNPQVTSTIRSRFKQAALYQQYVQGHSLLPAAPPGRSAHQYGWAFDMIVSPFDALVDLGSLWESWGGTWGGTRDPVHFELPGASEWLRQASDSEIEALLAQL